MKFTLGGEKNSSMNPPAAFTKVILQLCVTIMSMSMSISISISISISMNMSISISISISINIRTCTSPNCPGCPSRPPPSS